MLRNLKPSQISNSNIEDHVTRSRSSIYVLLQCYICLTRVLLRVLVLQNCSAFLKLTDTIFSVVTKKKSVFLICVDPSIYTSRVTLILNLIINHRGVVRVLTRLPHNLPISKKKLELGTIVLECN